MSGSNWLVLVAGVAAIGWVNWYFFFARRSAAAATMKGGTQQVDIAVHGGYEPGVIRVKRGLPVRLVFDRQETSSCSEEVVVPAFGIRRFLPAFKKTAVEFTPEKSGTFDVSCGMSMLHAKLVVED
jgi:plastocyanin domain-containing protein